MDKSEIELLDNLEGIHWWYVVRKKILMDLVKDAGNNLEILDLGSATGGNTISLIQMGHSLSSVEYSDTGVAIQKRKGLSVIQADARELPFSDDYFDLVVCLDVIEHIFEEREVANEIARVLKPGGSFILSVPEGKKLWSSHDVAVSHVKRYEKDEFKQLLETAGLRVSRIYSRNVFLKPLAIVVRKFSKGSNLGHVPWPINRLLILVATIENLMGTKNVRGMTIWAVGMK